MFENLRQARVPNMCRLLWPCPELQPHHSILTDPSPQPASHFTLNKSSHHHEPKSTSPALRRLQVNLAVTWTEGANASTRSKSSSLSGCSEWPCERRRGGGGGSARLRPHVTVPVFTCELISTHQEIVHMSDAFSPAGNTRGAFSGVCARQKVTWKVCRVLFSAHRRQALSIATWASPWHLSIALRVGWKKKTVSSNFAGKMQTGWLNLCHCISWSSGERQCLFCCEKVVIICYYCNYFCSFTVLQCCNEAIWNNKDCLL